MQLGDSGLEFGNGGGDELAGIENLVGIVEILVTQPLEAVDLVTALDDLLEAEAAPAVVG